MSIYLQLVYNYISYLRFDTLSLVAMFQLCSPTKKYVCGEYTDTVVCLIRYSPGCGN